mgnify:CR=1 FL=1
MEYLIHQVRQRYLQNAPAKRDIAAIVQKLKEEIDRKLWSSAREMKHLIGHIQTLIKQNYAHCIAK